ncbi:MAG: hypothetical protein Q4C10_05490 [Clostridia bacterium]|nr:hypothetical protein [Clostridia bacterium]
MKKTIAFLMALLFVFCAAALAEDPADGALYAGIEPWGNPLTVTLTSKDALSGVWSQNFGGDLFTQAFENAQDGFLMEGPLGDSDAITCRYTGTMALDGDALTVTFSDGEMTEASTEGGSTSYHVAALDETQRTVTLVPAVQGNYSGVTTLDAAGVEAFAAWARQLYLNEDWDAIAQLIDYPIIMVPDVEIKDADAFVAFMADKTVAESDMEAMAAENCVGMMSNDQGICLGSGELWLRDIAFDGVEQVGEPTLRIVAVNGLAD